MMRQLLLFLVALSLSLSHLASQAAINIYKFDDPVKKERFYNLIGQLRCTVCQNQTIAASNADLAKDLRDKVYKMIQEGKSDKQIKAFMVDRFTEFVLYNPPVKGSTYLLWAGPLILILIAISILFFNIRKKMNAPSEDISDGEHERIQALLKDRQDGKND
ncbi:MAG TPA: cytochrome c-type biogenesis protein CcmH [Gammaproteobacteria bacterium]|nr:cytochrome c-type biogenesis protein CcmH [Gammaproteobacteria bacterium]